MFTTPQEIENAPRNFQNTVQIGELDKEARRLYKALENAYDCSEINYYGVDILNVLYKVRTIQDEFKARNGADKRLMLPKFLKDALVEYKV